ncbi:uncharacterized protein [Montipora capricornis]|uniref:uncharacterized protein isoform X2 n=1 Tax=Montipora capricornis TaxID=246305 RepID=UPI0035F1155C
MWTSCPKSKGYSYSYSYVEGNLFHTRGVNCVVLHVVTDRHPSVVQGLKLCHFGDLSSKSSLNKVTRQNTPVRNADGLCIHDDYLAH